MRQLEYFSEEIQFRLKLASISTMFTWLHRPTFQVRFQNWVVTIFFIFLLGQTSNLSSLLAYLIGIVVGFLMNKEKAVPVIDTLKKHLKWLLFLHVVFGSVTFCTLIYNSLEILPDSMTFLVVIFNRTFQSIGIAFLFLYIMALKPKNELTTNKSDSPKEVEEEKVTLNVIKGFCRLSFALYVSNYLVIRSLFFSSRNTFPTTLVDWVSL